MISPRNWRSATVLNGKMPIRSGNRLGAATISDNTWIHRFVTLGVRPLVNTPVTPNHLTSLRLVTGLGACVMYGIGSSTWLLSGSGLLVLSLLLDRADGVLARLKDQRSEFGHRYDLISDVVVNIFIFVGLGIGLRAAGFDSWAPLMGIIAGLAVGGIFLCVIVIENAQGSGAAGLPAMGGVDVDDFMFVVPIGVALGGEQLLLVAAFIVAPIFALGFVWWFRRELFRRSGKLSTGPHETPEPEERP